MPTLSIIIGLIAFNIIVVQNALALGEPVSLIGVPGMLVVITISLFIRMCVLKRIKN